MRVWRAGQRDVDAVRRLRLRALASDPGAFGSSLAREEAFEPERWTSWVQRHAVFLAGDDGAEPVGLASGFLEEEDGVAGLVAMWVAPEARRAGVGSALVEAVAVWATGAGARVVRLRAFAWNEPARSLYGRAGFVARDGEWMERALR